MCMIVDANVVSALFNPKNSRHVHFQPILNWLLRDNGKLVYGGKTIKKEFSKLSSYLKILQILDTYRKIVRLQDEEVDSWEAKLKRDYPQKQFNDAHILAMVIVSNVRIVCTTDSKSLKYVTDLNCYPPGVKKPKIYSRACHSNLLKDKNIAAICRPCIAGSNDLYCTFIKQIGNG